MTKTELIETIADKANLSKTAAGNALNAALEAISQAVAAGDSVTLIGFGTFKSTTRQAREGRNPRTGAKLKIAAATTPRFVAGLAFKRSVAEAASAKGKAKKK